jgi:hypothetical protein
MVVLEGDGELEFVARLRPLPVEKKLEELAHILGLPFGPGIILQVPRVGLVGQQGLIIALNELAQDQSPGGQVHGSSRQSTCGWHNTTDENAR